MHRTQSSQASAKATCRARIAFADAKVAVVHEWLYTYAGAEKVLEQILSMFPQADLYSLIDFLPPKERAFLGGRKVHTSFLQNLPFVRRKHQIFLPLMPLAMERFDLSSYDIVISSSYAVAKGVLTGPNQLHVCYCHSPVRYAWDLQHQYLSQWRINRGIAGLLATAVLQRIRVWDHVTANGVDRFLSNSRFIARRIWKTYRRKAEVVYPPVEVDRFASGSDAPRSGFCTVSRLVGYKRVDVLVEAFRRLPTETLTVIGSGEELERLRKSAPPNVVFLGRAPNDVVERTLRTSKAFLFAAEEDFGISPVEAQACGTPVIAYGVGGSLESVRGTWCGDVPAADSTGVFFCEQTADSVADAVRFFLDHEASFTPSACLEHARSFSPENFRDRLSTLIEGAWKDFQASRLDPDRSWHPS